MLQILQADSLIAVVSLLTALVWLRKVQHPLSQEAPPGKGTRFRMVAGFLLLFYPVVAAVAAACTAALFHIAESRLAFLPPATYVIRPEPYICVWILPALLLGMQCGGAIIDLALAALMGPSYHQSIGLWGKAAHNPGILLRMRRGMGVMALVLMLPMIGYVTLFMPWNARFGHDQIVIHDLWAVGEQVYSYDDIDLVAVVAPTVREDQEEAPHQEIYVFLRDGRRWCDEDYGRRTTEYRTDDDKFLAFLCEKSGRPVTRVRSIEDLSGR